MVKCYTFNSFAPKNVMTQKTEIKIHSLKGNKMSLKTTSKPTTNHLVIQDSVPAHKEYGLIIILFVICGGY